MVANKGLIIGAAIGDCVHVAGVLNFLRLAREQGYDTVFLGPAVSVGRLIGVITESEPILVAIGYRLTPETARVVLAKLSGAVCEANIQTKFVFGGTTPVAQVASEFPLFSHCFGGDASGEEVVAYLQGRIGEAEEVRYPQSLLERLASKHPYPLIRHHFGLPSLSATIAGVAKIAEAQVCDIISLGPDQAAQASFFRPTELAKKSIGAGGVPLRSAQDLVDIYESSRCGNYPLVRCYSGTQDVLKWARLLVQTINNAWCAVPLSWYNVLDGRGPRSVLAAMDDAHQLMRWHGQRGIPLECNEAHHWSLRDAHDTIAVVMAYLAAYNSKRQGVSTYIAQYMLSTPPALSSAADLAKMLAKQELISDLINGDFQVLTQVRAGLTSFPANLAKAKGQLGYATMLGMALKPDIVHVVSFSEADHAATADDVIESCLISKQVMENCIPGIDLTRDPKVQARKQHLLEEARVLLAALAKSGQHSPDPLADSTVLSQAIALGMLDAPQLQPSQWAKGGLQTSIVDGGCDAIHPQSKKVISEQERINML